MKKNVWLQFIILISVFLVGVEDIYASHESTIDSVNSGAAVLVCEYAAESSNDAIQIYLTFGKIGSTGTYANQNGTWELFYKTDSSWKSLSSGSFSGVFMTDNSVHYDNVKSKWSSEEAFYCPPYGFIDTDFSNEICLTNYKTCGSNAGTNFRDVEYLSTASETIYSIIDKYANDTVYDTITLDDLNKISSTNGDLGAVIRQKTRNYITSKYSFGTTYKLPIIVDTYLNNMNITPSTERYAQYQTKMEQAIVQAETAGSITEEQAEVYRKEVAKNINEAIGSPGVIGIKPSDDPKCSGLLGAEMTEVVNNIFKFIRYLAPVLVAVFTIIDFIKVATSGDQELMKKSTNKFVKRVICAILLFFVPLICQMLFSVAGITVPETCIK